MSKNLREFEQIQKNLEYQKRELRVFVVDIAPKNTQENTLRIRLEELKNLVSTYGWILIVEQIQRRHIPDYKTYIGSGKLEEIISDMKEKEADLLIFGNILKPGQIYRVNEIMKPHGLKAWDRVDLILKIFERNAKTIESRLQIELASIKHMWPRIFSMSEELGSQWAGWVKGSRGKWETNTSIMLRHLKEREKHIKWQLEHYKKTRQTHRDARKNRWLFVAGIVWYTNAGKSSLLNILTKKWVLAENKLFATLGTSVGKMSFESKYTENGEYIPQKEMLLSDTIGFIRDLPPTLIEAFASTLEDSIESDILLHVIDVSDEDFLEKIQIVADILQKIWAHQEQIFVLNKIDLLSTDEREKLVESFGEKQIFPVSTVSGDGIWALKEFLLSRAYV